MKTAAEYLDSIRARHFNAYALGERLARPPDHPLIRPSLAAVALTYELAHDPAYLDLMRARSHLTGDEINRFTHIHQDRDDLVKKVRMLRLLGQKTGGCFQRCVGLDALNALYSVTFELDAAAGTGYHQRFLRFLRQVQGEDLVCDGAMTDPKGDRGRRPGDQAAADLYLRSVAERADGIVVRGAKCHQTGALNSHEIIVMPTTALRPGESAYAVSFAIPSDTQGLTYVVGRQPSDGRRTEPGERDQGNARYGSHECVAIFEDVFVPWERVFLHGEVEFAGLLVERFAAYHRQSYGGCKAGVGDVLVGAAAQLAEYQGVAGTAAVRDKLVEMVHLNETLYACGLAASWEGRPTPSGCYLVDLLLANVCKLNVTRFPYALARLAEDLAGGLLVTLPAEADWRHPAVGPLLEKYLRGIDGVPTECRLRLLRLLENLTLGPGAVAYRTESMHGAGSPQAQRLVIARQADLEGKKRLARELAGV